eukprot:3049117-Rhodomonas_salina.1
MLEPLGMRTLSIWDSRARSDHLMACVMTCGVIAIGRKHLYVMTCVMTCGLSAIGRRHPYLMTCELLQNKQLAAVLANSPYWLSLAPSAHSLEHGTILGERG